MMIVTPIHEHQAPIVPKALMDRLRDMGLTGAGHLAEIARYVGYYESYATSHQAPDTGHAFQEETRNAARILIDTVKRLRRRELVEPGRRITEPRPKRPGSLEITP